MIDKQGIIREPGISIPSDIFVALGLPVTDWNSINYACGNSHGKINPKAKYKPYAFGDMRELTDADRIANNYGMTPKAVDFTMDAWGQWSAPTEWMRFLDFNGYYHGAGEHVLKVAVSSEDRGSRPVLWNPAGSASNRDSYYTGTITFAADYYQLLLSDFSYKGISLANMRLTLWIGGRTGAHTFGGNVWATQSSETLGEWIATHPNGGQWSARMRTTDLRDNATAGSIGNLYDEIQNRYGGNSLVMIGPAPTYAGFDAADPGKPFSTTPTERNGYPVSVCMYPKSGDWYMFRQWYEFSSYAFVGNNTDLFGTVLMFLSVGKDMITDNDGYKVWNTVPASSAVRYNANTVELTFKDTICTHTTSNIKVTAGSKARLTAHINLCRNKGNTVEILESKIIKTKYEVTVDPSTREWTFTGDDFHGRGDDASDIDLTFNNTLAGGYLTLTYELNPDDVKILKNTDGSVSTDATIGSDGQYSGLATGIQRIQV